MTTKYISTRGEAPSLGFADVLMDGLASDGGLYVPESWPEMPQAVLERAVLDRAVLERGADLSYPDFATEVMWPFVQGTAEQDNAEGTTAKTQFAQLVAEAYDSFDHSDITPLVPLGDPDEQLYLMELFWGPTLAFKDVALQLLGKLFDAELRKRSGQITIVGATSGDTGSAAIEACEGRDTMDIFILHPHGRVSEAQRRQMTTVLSEGVHNIAIEGSFDDCQNIVKALFADAPIKDRLQLTAFNSINWARVMAQIVYYIRAVAILSPASLVHHSSADSPTIAFAVPTGNFGNVYAGYGARGMGVRSRFIVGTNRNDCLDRFFNTATLSSGEVVPTISPSMDIMIPSNLERLIFDIFGRNAADTAEFMQAVSQQGRADIPSEKFSSLGDAWTSRRTDDPETLKVIADTYRSTGRLIDPHTAVALSAAQEHKTPGETTVVLATAHPAKFPDAVEEATGVRPELPDALADLYERQEECTTLPNDLSAVRNFIEQRARITN